MNVLETKGVRLDGVYACLPSGTAENPPDLAKATGIRTLRRAAAGVTPLDLGGAAAERLLTDLGVDRAEIGAVVSVSFTAPSRMPAAAAQAQSRLGLPRDVLAFDVSLACSGWPYGLYLAALLARQTGGRTLLLDGDVQSAFMDPSDRSTAAVFADAGTAALVSPDDSAAPWRFAFLTDGAKGDALRLDRGSTIRMNGFDVFRFVATDVTAFLREFASTSRPFTFVPHQANVYMVSQLAKSLGVPAERLAVSCDEVGNCSSASVPMTLAKREVRGSVLASGFGGGLSVSAAFLEIGADCALKCFDYDV